jgi:hypothetical protein
MDITFGNMHEQRKFIFRYRSEEGRADQVLHAAAIATGSQTLHKVRFRHPFDGAPHCDA